MNFFFSGFYGILRGSFGIFCNYPNMLMESLEYLKDSLKFYGITKVCWSLWNYLQLFLKNYSRYSYLLELSLMSGSALLLVGPTGTGKSLCIREKMNLFNEELLVTLCLTFTAQTSSAQVQVIHNKTINCVYPTTWFDSFDFNSFDSILLIHFFWNKKKKKISLDWEHWSMLTRCIPFCYLVSFT